MAASTPTDGSRRSAPHADADADAEVDVASGRRGRNAVQRKKMGDESARPVLRAVTPAPQAVGSPLPILLEVKHVTVGQHGQPSIAAPWRCGIRDPYLAEVSPLFAFDRSVRQEQG